MKPPDNTAAVILAAGSSSRFGRPKQALMLNGETLVQRACRIALESGFTPVFLVLAQEEPAYGEIPAAVTILTNTRHKEGMGTSLALAAAALDDSQTKALVVMLADQPAVTGDLIHRLRARLNPPRTTLVLSDGGDRQGPPACFASCHFHELAQLTGDQGGKSIAAAHTSNVSLLDAPETVWDIDNEAAWQAFLSASAIH